MVLDCLVLLDNSDLLLEDVGDETPDLGRQNQTSLQTHLHRFPHMMTFFVSFRDG